jgi:hypothetical protein
MNLTTEQKFLCHGIRHIDAVEPQAFSKLYQEIGEERAWVAASEVHSIIAPALRKALPGNKVPSRWLDAEKGAITKIKSYMDALDHASNLLANEGIALLALKNSGIARGIYPHLAACPMGDIDVLVDKADFRRAHAILAANGFKLKFRCPFEEDNIEAAEEGGGAEYTYTLPNGDNLWFELQWRPVAGRWIQTDQEPRASDLIKRSIPIEGSKARLLSPEDNLLQVSLHTAKHTYVRAPGYRLHTDVDRIVRHYDIDWDVFCNRVTDLKLKTATYLSLYLAKELLETPIPRQVLGKLRPPSWKLKLMLAWLNKVGLFNPNEKKWSKLGYICFVSLLYDQPSDFFKGLFPKPTDDSENPLIWHCKRLKNLILRRVNT